MLLPPWARFSVDGAGKSPEKLGRLLDFERLHDRVDDCADERRREQGGPLMVPQPCACSNILLEHHPPRCSYQPPQSCTMHITSKPSYV